jgi:hypothetical protein
VFSPRGRVILASEGEGEDGDVVFLAEGLGGGERSSGRVLVSHPRPTTPRTKTCPWGPRAKTSTWRGWGSGRLTVGLFLHEPGFSATSPLVWTPPAARHVAQAQSVAVGLRVPEVQSVAVGLDVAQVQFSSLSWVQFSSLSWAQFLPLA